MEKRIWNDGIPSELEFWDGWLKNKGYGDSDYAFRLDPDAELQDELKALLKGRDDIGILDIGAGPLTFLGKNIDGKLVRIIATDALAHDFNNLLEYHGIIPPVRTIALDSENSGDVPDASCDLVTARNTIDHCYDPLKIIMDLPRLLKPGGSIWMTHKINEGLYSGWAGLHQWNFYQLAGCLFLSSKTEVFNLTEMLGEKYPGITIENKEENLMITTIITIP